MVRFFDKTHRAHVIIFLFFCLLSHPVFAQYEVPSTEDVQWERHESISGIFETKFPKKHRYNIYPFRFNENGIAFSVEILSALDSRPPTKNRNIFVRAVQTFGDELRRRTMKKILEREAEKYVQSIKLMGGKILANEDVKHNGFKGKRIYITYKENGEKFAMRIRIFMTNRSKVEQVLTGPAESVYSYRSDDFFNSLKLFDGITTFDSKVAFAEGWNTYTSPNNIFSTKLPAQNKDYTPKPPSTKSTGKTERMFFEIIDPVLNESVLYNVYTYKLRKTATYESAKNILFVSHVKRFVQNASINSLKTDNTIEDAVHVMATKLIISPPKKHPHITNVLFEVRYKDDTVIIQEVLSSAGHERSGITKLMIEQLDFHPHKYSSQRKKVSEVKETTKKMQDSDDKKVDDGINIQDSAEKMMDDGINIQDSAERMMDDGTNIQDSAEKMMDDGINTQDSAEKMMDDGINIQDSAEKMMDDGINIQDSAEKMMDDGINIQDSAEKMINDSIEIPIKEPEQTSQP